MHMMINTIANNTYQKEIHTQQHTRKHIETHAQIGTNAGMSGAVGVQQEA